MTPFPLRIVTPDGLEFEGQVEELIVRTTTGDLGILAGHTNCVAPLGMGRATVAGSISIVGASVIFTIVVSILPCSSTPVLP